MYVNWSDQRNKLTLLVFIKQNTFFLILHYDQFESKLPVKKRVL